MYAPLQPSSGTMMLVFCVRLGSTVISVCSSGHKEVSQSVNEDCGTDKAGNDVAIVNVCN
jgi:hypothetical protein